MSDPKLFLTAYYYSFDATGVREIDLILQAVAKAGKGYHNTEDWLDGGVVEPIQQAAKEAADAWNTLAPSPQRDRVLDEAARDAADLLSNIRESTPADNSPTFFGAEDQWRCPICAWANHELRKVCRNCGHDHSSPCGEEKTKENPPTLSSGGSSPSKR